MLNLIITPVYMAFDRVKQMCDAIDEFSTMPFIHILVDDNSPEMPPIKITENRKWILLRDTVHKTHNNQGRAMQLALDYMKHQYSAEEEIPKFDNFFLIESDVVVRKDWDKLQLEASSKIDNWATLDVISTYEDDTKVNYPTHENGAIDANEAHNKDFYEVGTPDFQCTLFSKEALNLDWKFTDFLSHFDILTGRKIKKLAPHLKFMRYKHIHVTHYPHSSRKILNPEASLK